MQTHNHYKNHGIFQTFELFFSDIILSLLVSFHRIFKLSVISFASACSKSFHSVYYLRIATTKQFNRPRNIAIMPVKKKGVEKH